MTFYVGRGDEAFLRNKTSRGSLQQMLSFPESMASETFPDEGYGIIMLQNSENSEAASAPIADFYSDCAARANRFFRAFKAASDRELWSGLDALEEDAHIFACDSRCLLSTAGETPPGGCLHPKKTFLSTRNSRRSSHVYLFWFYLLGSGARISDSMLQQARRLLRPACDFGLKYVSTCVIGLCRLCNFGFGL